MAIPGTRPVVRGFVNIGPAPVVDEANLIYAYSDCSGVIVEDGPDGPVRYQMDMDRGFVQLPPGSDE